MKKIEEFKIISPFWFSFLFIAMAFLLIAICIPISGNIIYEWIWIVCGLVGFSKFVGITYHCSFIYELKKNEILVEPLFGMLRKKRFQFKNLIKVIQWSEGIELTFDEKGKEVKVTIWAIQVNIGKLRVFLTENVSNLESLVAKKDFSMVGNCSSLCIVVLLY